MDKKKLNKIVDEMMKSHPSNRMYIGTNIWSFNSIEVWSPSTSINYSELFGFTKNLYIKKRNIFNIEIGKVEVQQLLTLQERQYIFSQLVIKITKRDNELVKKQNYILNKIGLTKDEFNVLRKMII